jgi:hypothetical protein
MEHWLKGESDEYPATWEGLYDLLKDVQLSTVSGELEEAVIAAHACDSRKDAFAVDNITLKSTGNNPTDTHGADEDDTRGADKDDTPGADEDDTRGADEDDMRGADEDDTRGADEDDTRGADEDNTSGADEDSTIDEQVCDINTLAHESNSSVDGSNGATDVSSSDTCIDAIDCAGDSLAPPRLAHGDAANESLAALSKMGANDTYSPADSGVSHALGDKAIGNPENSVIEFLADDTNIPNDDSVQTPQTSAANSTTSSDGKIENAGVNSHDESHLAEEAIVSTEGSYAACSGGAIAVSNSLSVDASEQKSTLSDGTISDGCEFTYADHSLLVDASEYAAYSDCESTHTDHNLLVDGSEQKSTLSDGAASDDSENSHADHSLLVDASERNSTTLSDDALVPPAVHDETLGDCVNTGDSDHESIPGDDGLNDSNVTPMTCGLSLEVTSTVETQCVDTLQMNIANLKKVQPTLTGAPMHFILNPIFLIEEIRKPEMDGR